MNICNGICFVIYSICAIRESIRWKYLKSKWIQCDLSKIDFGALCEQLAKQFFGSRSSEIRHCKSNFKLKFPNMPRDTELNTCTYMRVREKSLRLLEPQASWSHVVRHYFVHILSPPDYALFRFIIPYWAALSPKRERYMPKHHPFGEKAEKNHSNRNYTLKLRDCY